MSRSASLRGWGIGTAALVQMLVFCALAFGAPSGTHAAACATPSGPNRVRCATWIQTRSAPHNTRPAIRSTGTPQGYGPTQLQTAYALTTVANSTPPTVPTVGIVDAYGDSSVASDLAAYRSYYKLPACQTKTGSGCLSVVSQTGSTTRLPANNSSWALEISLDVDTVSAVCPHCHILLVEAKSASYADLGTAENEAVRLGAHIINNSWGGTDSSSDGIFDTAYFDHLGVAITAATGDSGYAAGPIYPSTSPYVTAVGGTTLSAATGTTRGYTETAWSGGGSGCSAYEVMPVWQSGIQNAVTACGAKRAASDVAADANPNTGVAVYDTEGYSGWIPGMVGGTSLSTQIIGAVYALAGNASTIMGTPGAGYTYGHDSYTLPNLFDITSGNNGTCSVSLQCTTATGWDGPTGLGAPDGITGF